MLLLVAEYRHGRCTYILGGSLLTLGSKVQITPLKQLLVRFCEKQGCQMVYFQNKNPNLGNFSSVSQWKMMVYVGILWAFGLFYSHLADLIDTWYVLG
jgi:hypothetical protein